MKKLVLIYLLVLGTFVSVKAQQIPLYSQYYYNPFLYNPAMAGYNSYGSIYLIDRMQWTGFPGAPVTRAFTMDGPLKINKVGLGLSVVDDQTGIFDRLNIMGAYSYNISFNEHSNLRLGLSAGFVENRINYAAVTVKDQKDAALFNQVQDRTSFDGTFGISYHYKDLLLGFAVPQLLAPKLEYMPNSNLTLYYSLVRHFIYDAKYDFHLSENKWTIEPMLYGQYAAGAPFLLDAGVNVKYKELAWLGLMWRKDFAISASAGIKLHDRITLGYSYDIMTSAISPYAGSTHEIVVGYTFGKAASKQNDIEMKLKDLNDKVDRTQKQNKVTHDSLKNELNKANRKIESQDSMIRQQRKTFEDFKRDIEDTVKNLRSSMHTSMNNGGNNAMSNNNGSGNNGNAVNSDDIPGYELNNINFGTDDAKLTKSSYAQLNDLAATMKKHPNLKIEIDGHCDVRGTDEFNQTLSEKRAAAVRSYLVKHGVKASNLTTKGYGRSKPVADNSTPEGMAKNRRVEIKVLSR